VDTRGERSLSPSTERIAELVAEVGRATDERAWSQAFRLGFGRLGRELQLHPAGSRASATFASAAATARAVGADCLPLGIALVMHLYPLCALRCVPLPWWSAAHRRRAWLLHAVDRHALILANAGSERAAGAHEPVKLSRSRDGIRIDGTYDYVSLAHVADVVLFSAPLASEGKVLFCAADPRADSVTLGANRFGGSMRLSDTCSVTFANHRVPADRYIEVPGDSALQCMAQYQRSWFQLLLGETHLARIERLHEQWHLPRPVEQRASLNELAQLREYSLRLLDDAASARAVQSLSRVSTAMKLRISWLAQSTATAVRSLDEAAATELGFLRRQPTPDERILESLDTAASAAAIVPSAWPAPAPAPAARTRSAGHGYTTRPAFPRGARHR
jgi:alkylation response protein AidB-like acyl-CoA dehydrogenase